LADSGSQGWEGVPFSPDSLMDMRYTYFADGNLQTIVDYKRGTLQTQSFSYDAANRLTTAGASGGSAGYYGPETYTYNAFGNLASKTGVGTYTYHSTKKHVVSATSNGWTFGYDANGRNVGTAYTLSYDVENRLTGVSGGNVSAIFIYNGNGGRKEHGLRVKAEVNGATTVYVGNHSEWNDSTLTKYTYAGSDRVSGLASQTQRQGSTPYYLLGDHLGSSMAKRLIRFEKTGAVPPGKGRRAP
jgi:hypothetical protein